MAGAAIGRYKVAAASVFSHQKSAVDLTLFNSPLLLYFLQYQTLVYLSVIQ